MPNENNETGNARAQTWDWTHADLTKDHIRKILSNNRREIAIHQLFREFEIATNQLKAQRDALLQASKNLMHLLDVNEVQIPVKELRVLSSVGISMRAASNLNTMASDMAPH